MSLSIEAKVRKQYPRFGLSGDEPVTKNLARLMGLRITLSITAYNALFSAFNNVLFHVLKDIDLQGCATAQSAVEMINQRMPQAIIANATIAKTVMPGQKMPYRFFLTELGTPTARFKYVLEATLGETRE